MARNTSTAKQKYPRPVNTEGGKIIRLKYNPQPKNYSQQLYKESLESTALTLGTGPAGAGKSFLAMSVAVGKLLANEVSKVVITRPVCEAGESLGFLPGTFEEKIAPYLLPLLDALNDLVGPTMAKKLLEEKRIEFAPLAYMRGRTFDNCLPADHLVLLSTNEWARMDEVIARFGSGEKLSVIYYDIETGEIQNKPITYAFKQPNQHKKLVKITLENGEIISATPDHKLFTQRGYVPVNKLTLNDILIGLDDAQNTKPEQD